jgi:hypothetical protein
MDAIARIKERRDELRQATRHVLIRVAKCMMLTVEFSKIYYKITNLSLEQEMLETVRNISFLLIILQLYIQIALSRKPFGIGHMFIYFFFLE